MPSATSNRTIIGKTDASPEVIDDFLNQHIDFELLEATPLALSYLQRKVQFINKLPRFDRSQLPSAAFNSSFHQQLSTAAFISSFHQQLSTVAFIFDVEGAVALTLEKNTFPSTIYGIKANALTQNLTLPHAGIYKMPDPDPCLIQLASPLLISRKMEATSRPVLEGLGKAGPRINYLDATLQYKPIIEAKPSYWVTYIINSGLSLRAGSMHAISHTRETKIRLILGSKLLEHAGKSPYFDDETQQLEATLQYKPIIEANPNY